MIGFNFYEILTRFQIIIYESSAKVVMLNLDFCKPEKQSGFLTPKRIRNLEVDLRLIQPNSKAGELTLTFYFFQKEPFFENAVIISS